MRFKTHMRTSILSIALALTIPASAQLDSAFNLSAYAEAYYSYELSNPDDHLRQGPFYSFSRHNETTLNLGFIKLGYEKDNVRGNLALMAGTYAQYNLAAEPELLRNVFEANVGVKLSKTRELWIDAGIMPSHIGFESAIGVDCWNLTRSLLAENSPYYEAGVKLGYTSPNEKWYASGMVLNGWQRIARPDGNNSPAFGTQLTYTASDAVKLNWSTFIGNDQPDSVSQLRYFNNLYVQVQITERFGLIAGFDHGMQQAASGDRSSMWMSPVLVPRFSFNERTHLAARWELYQDRDGVIVGATGTPNGYNTMGYSLNLDRQVGGNVLWRIEARFLQSEDKIFVDDAGNAATTNVFFTTSLAIRFP
ncbi:MAG TPA: porin [Flavobacteriales bacterium]|nr:porin [Flavobacteriales bacterium]